MKYVDNDKQNGILYDWDLIEKEYKKLKCPKGFFDLAQTDIKNSGWVVAMSPRATSGKTTNALLYGLLLYKEYGCKTCLVRSRDYMITKKMCGDIFNVILEFDYVSKIFGGKWNSINYFGGRFFLCKVNKETGEIEEKDEREFCRLFSVQSHANYKSTVNDYYNDFVVFDEFISDMYAEEEFEHFMDLLFTLFRLRKSGRVVLLSNTVDKNSHYFKELCIMDDVRKMDFGDSKTIESPLGTKVNVNMLKSGEIQKKLRADQIKMFFGFLNPKVQALTGDATWSIKNYPHIKPSDSYENLQLCGLVRYLELNGQFVRLEVVHSDNIGYACHVTRVTKNMNKKTPIFVAREIETPLERYGVGFTKADRFLWGLYEKNRFFYGTNEEGYLVERYLREFKENRKIIR